MQARTKLRYFVPFAFALISFAAQATRAETSTAGAGFEFRDVDAKSLGLWENGKPVLVYNHDDIAFKAKNGSTRNRAGYIHPLYGLDGEVLTDNHPKDHLHHHGVFWGWPHTKIGDKQYDFWNKEDIGIKFQKWLGKEVTPTGAKLGVENAWMIGDKEVAKEEAWFDVHPATAEGRAIDVSLTWTPTVPITLAGAEGKSYGGFAVRYAPRTETVITVPSGRSKEDLLITKLPWADFTGQFKDAKESSGVAVFVKPDHPDFPPEWMTRDYGMLAVGWPGVNSRTLEPGKPVTVHYRLWIHRGNPEAAEIQKQYDAYAKP